MALSVIVPARNAGRLLDKCLQGLEASAHPDFEIIVVDDASTDDTADVARQHGVQLIQLDSRSGPAVARNRGADVARHPYLFFLDADVLVAPETLGQVAEVFAGDADVDALFGSYDDAPGAPNAVSQYRNLLHHWVHQTSRREASSFWTGCGAIKRSAFFAVRGLDAAYDNACIEDIELGTRLRRAGFRVVLSKHIQVQHLKPWTLWSMVQVDVLRRGIPWTRLLLREKQIPNELNLRTSQRLSALLALGMVAAWAVGSWHHPGLLLVPVLVFAGIAAADRWTDRQPGSRGPWILVAVTFAAAVATPFALATDVGELIQPWSLAGLACLLGILAINLRFYLFLARTRHPLFALLSIPLHVLYFLYSTLAFAVAAALHLVAGTKSRAVSPRPGEETR